MNLQTYVARVFPQLFHKLRKPKTKKRSFSPPLFDPRSLLNLPPFAHTQTQRLQIHPLSTTPLNSVGRFRVSLDTLLFQFQLMS